MKHIFTYLKELIVFSTMLMLCLSVYSQSIEIVKNQGRPFIVEKYGINQYKVIPTSGISYYRESNIVKVPQSQDNINILNWVLKFSVIGKVFKDISFANSQVGYIVTELGAVYKSTNGGDNWTNVMNLGFPYYWYGVCALTQDTVVIAGFNDQANIHSGVIRWSFNGGSTWTGDISISVPSNGVGWLTRIHFFD